MVEKLENTIIVLIGDNEFWKGSYAGRAPVNKKNLGDLILSLSKLKPRVIALDFNFCSPTIDGSVVENNVYLDETRAFSEAVKNVSASECTVVLTKFLHVVSSPERGCQR